MLAGKRQEPMKEDNNLWTPSDPDQCGIIDCSLRWFGLFQLWLKQ